MDRLKSVRVVQDEKGRSALVESGIGLPKDELSTRLPKGEDLYGLSHSPLSLECRSLRHSFGFEKSASGVGEFKKLMGELSFYDGNVSLFGATEPLGGAAWRLERGADGTEDACRIWAIAPSHNAQSGFVGVHSTIAPDRFDKVCELLCRGVAVAAHLDLTVLAVYAPVLFAGGPVVSSARKLLTTEHEVAHEEGLEKAAAGFRASSLGSRNQPTFVDLFSLSFTVTSPERDAS